MTSLPEAVPEQGSLGEKLFEGASADIHAWAPGRVVKLFKPGFLRFLFERA